MMEYAGSTAPSSPVGKVTASEVASWLNEASLIEYRQNYQRFRKGRARGAQGDVSDVGFARFRDAICPPRNEEIPATDPITAWRLAYRRYRLGDAHGAKGSVDSVAASIDSIDLLPIVQALALKQKLAKGKPTTKPQPAEAVHVHFGGGKLGVGLVLPALAASKFPFVIIQSNSGAYQNLAEKIQIVPNGNSASAVSLNVFYANDETKASELDSAISDLSAGHGLLLLSGRSNALSLKRYLCMTKATSFSCSVGPGLATLADLLSVVKTKAPLFACENDHKGVVELSRGLSKVNSGLTVIPCMVDRICTGLQRTSSSEIAVTTEPFEGEILLLDPKAIDTGTLIPFGGPTLRAPQLDAQAKYFAERKLLLVNGGHTVLAFLTLLRMSEQSDLSPWTPPGRFLLLNWDTCSVKERQTLWSFSIARLLLLCWQYDAEVLKNAHDVTTDRELCEVMLDYAKKTVTRFSAVPDYTDRILGGGVDNRYLGRLRNVSDFLGVTNVGSTPLGRELLQLAGVNYCAMVSCVHNLVEGAHQFTRTIEQSFGVSLF